MTMQHFKDYQQLVQETSLEQAIDIHNVISSKYVLLYFVILSIGLLAIPLNLWISILLNLGLAGVAARIYYKFYKYGLYGLGSSKNSKAVKSIFTTALTNKKNQKIILNHFIQTREIIDNRIKQFDFPNPMEEERLRVHTQKLNSFIDSLMDNKLDGFCFSNFVELHNFIHHSHYTNFFNKLLAQHENCEELKYLLNLGKINPELEKLKEKQVGQYLV